MALGSQTARVMDGVMAAKGTGVAAGWDRPTPSICVNLPVMWDSLSGKMKGLSRGAWRGSVNDWPAAELQEMSSRQRLKGAHRGCQEQELHLWCRHNLVDYGHHSF